MKRLFLFLLLVLSLVSLSAENRKIGPLEAKAIELGMKPWTEMPRDQLEIEAYKNFVESASLTDLLNQSTILLEEQQNAINVLMNESEAIHKSMMNEYHKKFFWRSTAFILAGSTAYFLITK